MGQNKKLILISAYNGLVNRGVETVVGELSKRLEKELMVWTITGGKEQTSGNIVIPIKIHKTRNRLLEMLFLSPKKASEFVFYMKAFGAIFEIRPDIVMVYNSGWHLVIYKAVSRLLKFKIILSGQSGPGWDDKFNLFLRPDVFVCLTRWQKNWATKISANQRYAVIPNGVDVGVFYSKSLRNKTPVVLTVAASENAKNVDEVIMALKDTDYKFLYLGDGSQASRLDSLGKATLGDRYQRKSLSHDKLPDIYRSADVFVFLQSRSEAFGIVFIEAAASGLPIVCFDDPIRRELLGDNAYYCKDDQDVLENIKKALSKKRISTDIARYDWDRIANEYYQLIMKI